MPGSRRHSTAFPPPGRLLPPRQGEDARGCAVVPFQVPSRLMDSRRMTVRLSSPGKRRGLDFPRKPHPFDPSGERLPTDCREIRRLRGQGASSYRAEGFPAPRRASMTLPIARRQPGRWLKRLVSAIFLSPTEPDWRFGRHDARLSLVSGPGIRCLLTPLQGFGYSSESPRPARCAGPSVLPRLIRPGADFGYRRAACGHRHASGHPERQRQSRAPPQESQPQEHA